MDFTTNSSLNDGKISQNFWEWVLFYHPLCALLDLAQFGASLSNFLAHKGLNGSKSCTVGQNITFLYLWGPLWTILANFRPFQHDFRAQSMTLRPVGSQFLTFFAVQKTPKGPHQYSMFTLYMILGHLGHLGHFG